MLAKLATEITKFAAQKGQKKAIEKFGKKKVDQATQKSIDQSSQQLGSMEPNL